MQEIELTFLVPQARLKGLMRQAKVKSSQQIPLAAHYYDTPKQSLAQAGIGLRIRKEGDDWVQTIKAYGDGIAARLEHNVLLDNARVQTMLDAGTLMPDLSIYADTSIEPVLADFNLKKLSKKLTCLYVTDVQRTSRLLTENKKATASEDGAQNNSIEVAYDYGKIIHGNDAERTQPIQEIEFELISGELGFLFSTAKTWCKRYKLCLSTVTKAERGGLLINEQEYSPAVSANLEALDISPDTSLPAFVRAAVHHCLLQILPNSSAIIEGSQNDAHILQLCIGIQRLQLVLNTFKNFSEQLNPEWLPILAQTERLLSDYRTHTHLVQTIQPQLELQGAAHIDWTTQLQAVEVTANDAVRANDFQLTLLELIAFTMSDASGEPQADKLAADKIAKILSKKHGKLLKALSHLDDLEATDASDNKDADTDNKDAATALHKVRGHLTDLRYLSEFTAPLYDQKGSKKKAARLLKCLSKAQNTLGRYLDNGQYQQYYQQQAASDTNALFGAGWFGALVVTDTKRCQKRLAKIPDTATFW